jgi:hypothetical protein
MPMRARRVVLVNKCQCAQCKDVIESKYRHDFVQCMCGSIFTDGGTDYLRRGGCIENIIDMSDTYDEDYWSEH